MTHELNYFCKVDDTGTLQGFARKKFATELKRFFKGQGIEILVRKKKKFRSVQQNRYYWLIVSMFSDHTGYTKEESHSVFKSKFLKTEKVNENTGAIYEYVKSTTELSTIEYNDYLEDVRRFASEDFGIVLPEPNEQIEVFQ